MEEVAFKPEIRLSHDQRAQLSHTIATPGFALINSIMRAVVDKFVVDLINVDEGDDRAILAKHKLSKAAAQFYQIVVNRVNAEAQQFMHDAGSPSVPVDPTEGLIDLGEFAKDTEPQSSLLSGFDVNEQLIEEELNGE